MLKITFLSAAWMAHGLICANPTAASQSSKIHPVSARKNDEVTRTKIAKAKTLAENGQYSEAIRVYSEGLALQPQSEPAALGLADAYRKVHNDEEARASLNAARRKHPRSVPILRALGNLEMDARNYSAAIEDFKAALRVNPREDNLRVQLASGYLETKNSREALRELNRVLSSAPENAAARFLRAQIYADEGENQKAQEDAGKVIESRPNYLPARQLNAKVLLRLKECDRALESLRREQDLAQLDAGELFILAGAYDCAGQKEAGREARARFESASQAEHQDSENRVQSLHLVEQANALALQNKLSDAQELLRQALDKNPQNGFAYSQLAKIYSSMQQIDQAREAIATALKLQPYQPDFLFVKGVIEAQSGNLEEALSALQAVTYINPREADAYFEIGKLWMQKGDRLKALEAFRRAAELSPEDEEYKRAVVAASQPNR